MQIKNLQYFSMYVLMMQAEVPENILTYLKINPGIFQSE